MAELFILLPENSGDEVLFAWHASGDWSVDTAPPRGQGQGERAIAFVPGTRVTVHRAEISVKKPAEARRLALFALEDDLAQPVEALHAALGVAGDGAEREIQVASATDVQAWIAALRAVGLPDADLVAPQACLPDAPGMMTGPDETLVRTVQSAFALDRDVPDDLVRSLAADVQPFGEAIADRSSWLIQLAAWYEAAGHVTSLRQGDYSVRRPMQLDALAAWRPVAGIAAAAAILWLGSVWLETRALDKQAGQLEAQTRDLVMAVAPDANGQLAVALQTLRQGRAAGSSSLRPTMATAALYEAIEPVEGAEMRSLRFDASTGRLNAMVVFGSYADADAIGARLEEKGLSVRLGEARQNGQQVMGEFAIEAAS